MVWNIWLKRDPVITVICNRSIFILTILRATQNLGNLSLRGRGLSRMIAAIYPWILYTSITWTKFFFWFIKRHVGWVLLRRCHTAWLTLACVNVETLWLWIFFDNDLRSLRNLGGRNDSELLIQYWFSLRGLEAYCLAKRPSFATAIREFNQFPLLLSIPEKLNHLLCCSLTNNEMSDRQTLGHFIFFFMNQGWKGQSFDL